MAAKPREIVITTDVLNKAEINKLRTEAKRTALRVLSDEIENAIFTDIRLLVEDIIKSIISENRKEFEKKIRATVQEQFAADLKRMRLCTEVEIED